MWKSDERAKCRLLRDFTVCLYWFFSAITQLKVDDLVHTNQLYQLCKKEDWCKTIASERPLCLQSLWHGMRERWHQQDETLGGPNTCILHRNKKNNKWTTMNQYKLLFKISGLQWRSSGNPAGCKLWGLLCRKAWERFYPHTPSFSSEELGTGRDPLGGISAHEEQSRKGTPATSSSWPLQPCSWVLPQCTPTLIQLPRGPAAVSFLRLEMPLWWDLPWGQGVSPSLLYPISLIEVSQCLTICATRVSDLCPAPRF